MAEKILTLAFLMTSLAAGGALAQIDPDPDGIGVYFDAGATAVAATASAGETVTAYLVLTNPSGGGDLAIWDAAVGADPHSGAAITGTAYGSFNYATNMPGDSSWHCIAMYFDPPLAAEPATPLAELHIPVPSAESPVLLYIWPGGYYGVAGTEGPYIELHPASGSSELPVAVINGEPPLPAAPGTWSGMKSLFR